MKQKFPVKYVTFLSLVVSCLVFYSCEPKFLAQPPENNKIYAETDANGTRYYCYFNISNISKYDCQLGFESPLKNLALVSPIPIKIPADKTIEAKFEIRNFDQNAPCPSPCVVEEIKLKGQWADYNKAGYFYEQSPKVEWSSPITQINFWVPENPPGAGGNIYLSTLCSYITQPPALGFSGGKVYKWSEIGAIYNPNDFDVQLLVNHVPMPTNPCFAGLSQAEGGLFATLAAHSYFDYGNTIRQNFKPSSTVPEACLRDNDPFVYIWSTSGKYSYDSGNTKWIGLKLTIQ
jgi:hypothetical protein